jgi:Rod binding domain-containing protein
MQPITPPSFLQLPQPGFSYQKPTAETREAELKKAVDEFAAVLYSQMFREMREAGKTEGAEDGEESIFGGGDSNMFMHLMDQEVGKAYAASGGNGLKEALYRQLSGRMATQVEREGTAQ